MDFSIFLNLCFNGNFGSFQNYKDLEEIEFKCVAVKNNESLLKNQSDVKQVHNETRWP